MSESQGPAVPDDVVDALDENEDALIDEIVFIEKVAKERGDIMDFRAGAMSATSHLRRQFDLGELEQPRIVDALAIQQVAAHLDTALEQAEDSETRFHLRQASQLLFAMVQEEP